jgi:bacillithiol biosynthesis deacetylase BshB1
MNTNLKPVEVLAIGAHPDDVELCCSGTLVKMAALGHTVGVIDLTAGEMGTRGNKELRLKEAQKAGEILGLAFRANLSMPDGRLSATEENEHKVIHALRTVRPRILIAQNRADTHPDHVAGAAIVESAYYKSGFRKYPLEGDPFKPERLITYTLHLDIQPTFVVDITAHIATRRNAILAYESQFYNPNMDKYEGKSRITKPEFLDFLETRIKYYGQRILKPFGEPFCTRELAEVDDPAGLRDGLWR